MQIPFKAWILVGRAKGCFQEPRPATRLVLSSVPSRLFIAGDMTDHSVWLQLRAGGSYINLERLFSFEYEPKDFSHFRAEENLCFCHAASFANKTTGINCWKQQFLMSTKQFCKWPDFPQILHKNPPNFIEQPLPSHISSMSAEERQNWKLHIPILVVQTMPSGMERVVV